MWPGRVPTRDHPLRASGRPGRHHRAGWVLGSLAGALGSLALPLVAATPTSPGTAATPLRPSSASTKRDVLDRLTRLNQSSQFLFGEENATVWGMYLDGRCVSTNDWFSATAQAGRFTSDSEALVGDHPAVLGITLGMLAFEPTTLRRRPVIAEAVRRQIAQDGLVTMDWHAPSCNAKLPAAGKLATVSVNGHDIELQAVAGGALFHAEEEYTRPITSRADVPDSLRCLCQIANDLPLTAGPYQGVSGKTWLIAHAKYAARVLREEGLAGLPIVVRPFHEHNGNWFWWGEPYWNCAALLDNPEATSGAAAYQAMVRTFVTALRDEPDMDNLLFAYSPDQLLGRREKAPPTRAQSKAQDPPSAMRELLRARLVRELEAAGLAYLSPARANAVSRSGRTKSTKQADRYVAERRRYYVEGYAGDDLFDVLGIDLYHPIDRPANGADLKLIQLQLRALAEEAGARQKPFALTEAGTLRLSLLQLASQTPAGRPMELHGRGSVVQALARLFAASDRVALLRRYGLAAAGPVRLSATERRAVVPGATEDWYNRQLLVLAKEARVAYALVWQTYAAGPSSAEPATYFVPYPGHPEAKSFARFYADPATCFLRDGCPR
jgi:hypothetical protein